MYCKNCGNNAPDNVAFCPFCNTQVQNVAGGNSYNQNIYSQGKGTFNGNDYNNVNGYDKLYIDGLRKKIIFSKTMSVIGIILNFGTVFFILFAGLIIFSRVPTPPTPDTTVNAQQSSSFVIEEGFWVYIVWLVLALITGILLAIQLGNLKKLQNVVETNGYSRYAVENAISKYATTAAIIGLILNIICFLLVITSIVSIIAFSSSKNIKKYLPVNQRQDNNF